MRVRDLYAAHCGSIFSALVYNPLVYSVIGAFGLLDHLFPVLFRWLDLMSGGARL